MRDHSIHQRSYCSAAKPSACWLVFWSEWERNARRSWCTKYRTTLTLSFTCAKSRALAVPASPHHHRMRFSWNRTVAGCDVFYCCRASDWARGHWIIVLDEEKKIQKCQKKVYLKKEKRGIVLWYLFVRSSCFWSFRKHIFFRLCGFCHRHPHVSGRWLRDALHG